jgi:hypothetical protein
MVMAGAEAREAGLSDREFCVEETITLRAAPDGSPEPLDVPTLTSWVELDDRWGLCVVCCVLCAVCVGPIASRVCAPPPPLSQLMCACCVDSSVCVCHCRVAWV